MMPEYYLPQLEAVTLECTRLRQELRDEKSKNKELTEQVETLQKRLTHIRQMTGWQDGM